MNTLYQAWSSQLCNCGHLEYTKAWPKPFNELDQNHTGFPPHPPKSWDLEFLPFQKTDVQKRSPHQVKSSVFLTVCTVLPYKANAAIMNFYEINLAKYVKYKL